MRKSNTIATPHPNAPKRLWRLYKIHKGNCYNTAKLLKVNPSHIWKLLKFGHEPKREDLRVKLFLKVKRAKSPNPKPPDFIKQWNKLSKEERHKVIKQYLNWKHNKIP